MLHSVLVSGIEICAAVLLNVYKTVILGQRRGGVNPASHVSQVEIADAYRMF